MEILATVSGLEKGVFAAEASERMQQVIAAVRQHGKPGAVTITLKVKPAVKESGDLVVVVGEIKTKVPEADRAAELFYTTEQGGLSKQDPRQPELPLRMSVIDMKKEAI